MPTRRESNRPVRATLPNGLALSSTDVRNRIIPGDPPRHAGDEESLDVWGFRDSAFTLLPNGNVVFSGSRYPLCGAELPDLLPWTRDTLGVAIEPDDIHDSTYPPDVPAARAIS